MTKQKLKHWLNMIALWNSTYAPPTRSVLYYSLVFMLIAVRVDLFKVANLHSKILQEN